MAVAVVEEVPSWQLWGWPSPSTPWLGPIHQEASPGGYRNQNPAPLGPWHRSGASRGSVLEGAVALLLLSACSLVPTDGKTCSSFPLASELSSGRQPR